MPDKPSITRRQALSAISAGTTVALGGCLGFGETSTKQSRTDTPTQSPEPSKSTDADTPTEVKIPSESETATPNLAKQTESIVSTKVDKLLSDAAWLAGGFKSAKSKYKMMSKNIKSKIKAKNNNPESITKSDLATIDKLATGMENWMIDNVFPHYRKHAGRQYIKRNRSGRKNIIPKIERFIELGDIEKVLVNFKKLAGRIAFMSWESEHLLIPERGVEDTKISGIPTFDEVTGTQIYGVHYPDGGMTYHVGDSFVNETKVARRESKKPLEFFSGEKLLIAAGSSTAQEHGLLQIKLNSTEKAKSEYDKFIESVTNDGSIDSKKILVPLPATKLAWGSNGKNYAYSIRIKQYIVIFGIQDKLWENKNIGSTWINKQGKI